MPVIRFGSVLASVALACIAGGCADACRSVSTPPSSRPDVPYVFAWRLSGNVPAGYDRSGLLMAVWADGRAIRAASRRECGQSYVRATLSPAELAQVGQAIERSGVLRSKREATLVVDFPVELFGVRFGRTFCYREHTSDIAGTANADSFNPRLAAAIDALMATPLHDAQPEPADQWRGAVPDAWEQ